MALREAAITKRDAQPTPPVGGPRPGMPLPPLENGDRLTRYEFERRYEAMPYLKKAELIEGVVHMPFPVRTDVHGQPHSDVNTWLGVYRAATPGIGQSDNGTLRLDADNDVQPDVMLWIEGGQARLDEDGYLAGAPELVVEIAASTASIDLHEKKRVYRRNGVREYMVWPVYDKKIEWFELREGEYAPLAPDENGVIHSRVFPGLRLAVKALLDGNLAEVLAELQKGITSAEHAAFVAQLAAKRLPQGE